MAINTSSQLHAWSYLTITSTKSRDPIPNSWNSRSTSSSSWINTTPWNRRTQRSLSSPEALTFRIQSRSFPRLKMGKSTPQQTRTNFFCKELKILRSFCRVSSSDKNSGLRTSLSSSISLLSISWRYSMKRSDISINQKARYMPWAEEVKEMTVSRCGLPTTLRVLPLGHQEISLS